MSPVDQTTTLAITCDNPNCPGNDLPTDDRAGWLFVSAEVYGETGTSTHVYCSTSCVSANASALDTREQPEATPADKT